MGPGVEPWRHAREGRASSEGEASGEAFDGFLIPTALYLLAALALGGSSTMLAPTAVLEIAAIPLLAIAIPRLAMRPPGWEALWPLLIAAAAVLAPLAQLIPLPPDIWRELPGHQVVAEGYAAAVIAPPQLPISLAPGKTWAALFKLLPPIAIFCSVLTLRDGARRALAAVVLAVTLVSIGLAIVQRSGGEGHAFYGVFDLGRANGGAGVFANRNHQGLMMAAALPFVALLLVRPFGSRGVGQLALTSGAGLIFLLVVGAIVTTSRAALVLTPLGGLAALVVAGAQVLRGDNPLARRAPVMLLGGAAVLGAGLVLAVAFTPILGRFQGGLGADLRLELAPAVARAGLDFAPLGAGLGSFADVYGMYETPASIGPNFVNHAHNEYLEIWLEAGVAGLILMGAFLAWWVWAAAAAQRRPASAARATALAGAFVVGLFLVHSLVDYPARTPALASLFALGCGFLVEPWRDDGASLKSRRRMRAAVTAVVCLPLLAVAGWTCITHGLSDYYSDADPSASLRWNPRNAATLSSLAERDFGLSATNPALRPRALAEARAALTAAPLDPRAFRVLALAAEADGRPGDTRRLMRAGARRSLRDNLVVVWLFLDDLQRRDFAGAMAYADVVLRQTPDLSAVLFPQIRDALSDPRARAAVVATLAREPDWRGGLLRTISTETVDFGPARLVYAGLRETPRPPTGKEVGDLAMRLADSGLYQQAYWEWSRQPGLDREALARLVYDGGFKGQAGGPPFNWRLTSGDDAYAGIDALDDGSNVLAAEASGRSAVLAEQMLVLPPGDYVFSVQVKNAGDRADGDFDWQVTCAGVGGELMRAAAPPAPGGWRTLSVPLRVSSDCPAQLLRLRASSRADRTRVDAYFRAVEIRR